MVSPMATMSFSRRPADLGRYLEGGARLERARERGNVAHLGRGHGDHFDGHRPRALRAPPSVACSAVTFAYIFQPSTATNASATIATNPFFIVSLAPS